MCLLCQIHCTVCHTALTNFDTPNRKRKCLMPSSAHHIHACLFCICSNVLFHASHICVCSFSFENVLYNARNKQIMKHYVQYMYIKIVLSKIGWKENGNISLSWNVNFDRMSVRLDYAFWMRTMQQGTQTSRHLYP